MGNSSTKEQRSPSSPTGAGPSHGHGHRRNGSTTGQAGASDERSRDRLTTVYSSRTGRGSRPDLSFLGLGSSSNAEAPEVRRETKQEREARKLAKERELREKERERSMREEHIDGGYCVTQGVYTGPEDFNKAVVRQLMIERRIAPFWKGLNDFKEDWAEHQLVAAARGLPIPAADEIPPEAPERPVATDLPRSSTPVLQHLMVPITARSQSYGSDASASLSASHPAFSLPPPTSPIQSQSNSNQSSTPFRPRSKTVASLTTSFKNTTQPGMVPRELHLPPDPYVNGQPIEAFLYKDASECPICFVYYPPYLNRTRCCDQPICSECFVQIKRPDPHPPEHEQPDPANTAPRPEMQGEPESLVSEPANCPYCQQAEFGVTYEPPPFRRGLAYAMTGNRTPVGNFSSAMSSSSSLNSTGSPSLAPKPANRRRTTSISANASTVITTDRIRPDWATKLANARNHAARRSAAATALHTAAYLMGNGVTDSRGFAFSSRSRFGRRGGDSPGSGSATPATPSSAGPGGSLTPFSALVERHEARSREAGPASRAERRRTRMEDLEDMMMLEAIRLSLAAEEERKRKEEKDAKKEAKKKEKEAKKADKAADKAARKSGLGGYSSASASGSALSLSLPGMGRRRGNSGSSLLRENASNTDKGKSVERSPPGGSSELASAPVSMGKPLSGTGIASSRQHLDPGTLPPHTNDNTLQPSNQISAPEKPSHLRQMSNASSPASSFMESLPGSLGRNNGFHHGSSSSIDSPNASGIHLAAGSRSGDGTRDGDAQDEGSAGLEPMFNFQSLAGMMGLEEEVGVEKGDGGFGHVEFAEGHGKGREQGESSAAPSTDLEESVVTLRPKDDALGNVVGENVGDGNGFLGQPKLATPELMVTPVTPVGRGSKEDERMQLGAEMDFGRDATQ